MISQIAILVGILAALVAGGAQAIAHRYAQRQRWHPIARYTCGVTVIGAAFAVPLFVALPVESAAALLFVFALIVGTSGLATWLSYEADPKPSMDLESRVNAILAEHGDE